MEKKSAATDVAVIGMSGRFPEADNVNEFWNNLINGKNSIKEIPKERWDTDKYYDPSYNAKNKTYTKWGGFIDDIDKFDPLFFNIPPIDAKFIDPQQRLFFQESWRAMEDAGYTSKRRKNLRCGVFVGVSGNDYPYLVQEKGVVIPPAGATSNMLSSMAARLSYFLDLQGPCMAVDTASSSGLTAVTLACESIKNGKADMALVGGVNIWSTVQLFIAFSSSRILSPSNLCRSFDKSADGLVVGESVAIVVLKSLNMAIKDNDRIYGVIKSAGINQNGRNKGFLLPSAEAQARLLKEVYIEADIDPESVSYIETQGSGMSVGNIAEVNALKSLFDSYTAKKRFCALGTIETNIGHTFAASGVASLIKVLLCMKYKKLTRILNYEEPDENIKLEQSAFYINDECKTWESENNNIRIAGVNSFGFTGINCHLILEEYRQPEQNKKEDDKPNSIIFSAKNADRLNGYANEIKRFLEKDISDGISIRDIAYTLQIGREEMEERVAIVARDKEELEEKLSMFLTRKEHVDIYKGSVKKEKSESDSPVSDTGLGKLASLWTKGISIDWEKLPAYEKDRPLIVSIPGYPFDKKRYWID